MRCVVICFNGILVHYDDIITITHNNIGNIIAIIPFQFLAYCLGIVKNTNPDKPKHLAKTVTVS